MKKIYLCLITIVFLFSCGEKGNEEIYQGKLEEFFLEGFSLEKDSITRDINIQKMIEYEGSSYFLSKEENGYSLYNPISGKKDFSFVIPAEGPESLKGYAIASQGFDGNEFVAISSLGNVKRYVDGEQLEEIDLDWTDYEELNLIQFSDHKDNFMKVGLRQYQVVNNPVNPFGETYVDVKYKKWIAEFDMQKGWICTSNLTSGLGEEFANSGSAAHLETVYNNDRDEFFVMFSPSDSIYQIKNCKVVARMKLPSMTKFEYLPGIFEENGRNRSWKNNPNSASNVVLAYNPLNQLYIRVVKVKTEETQPEITDIRMRRGLNSNTYLMLIYDLEWNLKAELEMFYDVGQSLGNVFTTVDGVFITKPNQKSEDEYEFYKIDLSRFGDN